MAQDRQFVFDLLEREDKVFLGGGKYLIYAPDFHPNEMIPGYADHACFYHAMIPAPLMVGLVDAKGKAREVTFQRRSWQPGRVIQHYTSGQIEMVETKFLSNQDCLGLNLELRNHSEQTQSFILVVYTILHNPAGTDFVWSNCFRHGNVLCATGSIRPSEKPFPLNQVLGLAEADRSAVMAAEQDHRSPNLRLHPFYEYLAMGGIPDVEITANYNGNPANWISLVSTRHVEIPAGGQCQMVAGTAFATDLTQAEEALQAVLSGEWTIAESHKVWQDFFAGVPCFRCSDEWLERYYWYRWFGMRLNYLPPGPYGMKHPAVTEGINPGWFRHLISYSAQVHMREMMWQKDPSTAIGSFLNFMENPAPDGCVRGGLGHDIPDHRGSYLGDWGRNLLDILNLHPEAVDHEHAYKVLEAYVRYMEKERDIDRSGLFDIINQSETGQEYMERYLFADPKADHWGPFRLKGIDFNVYAYGMYRALAALGPTSASQESYQKKAAWLAEQINQKFYSEKLKGYVDLRVNDHQQSPNLHANSFYPFFTSIAKEQHLPALRETLRNEQKFWTAYPCPSSALDERESNPVGRWRHLATMCCPWNGRSWLMSSCQVVDALCHASRTLAPDLEDSAVTLFNRFIRMLFLEGNPRHPSSYEYYNPLTGEAPYFRGTEDYMHSYIVDLIIRYVGGVWLKEEGGVSVYPLDFGVDFKLSDVPLRGGVMQIERKGEHFMVSYGEREWHTEWKERKEIRVVD